MCARYVPWLIELKQAKPGNMQVRVHVTQAPPLAGTRKRLADAALGLCVSYLAMHYPLACSSVLGVVGGAYQHQPHNAEVGRHPGCQMTKNCAD